MLVTVVARRWRAMPRLVCPKCKATDTVQEGGSAICGSCGCVLEENPIVSEITWMEEPGGASAVVGQFVSNTGAKIFRKGGPGGHAKESREVTIENGRRKIAQIAGGLKLKQHHIEAAQRLFMLAVQHNFIQGRKTQNVVAACLYIVCRREKTPHMLIDFADMLQTNVFVLGHTYLRFCKRLNLQLPIIDPSLYIPRFCGKLEFEEKTQMVANTALRLVQRMRRDWLQTGRRPSGICGAALLISARLHGFKRSQKEVIQVVRICDVTLRRRLKEFAKTPSANMTQEDFEAIEIEEECDPPAFTRALEANEKKEKELQENERKEKEKRENEKEKQSKNKSKNKKQKEKDSEKEDEEADEEEREIAREMAEALGSEEIRRVEADPQALVQQAQRDLERDPNDFTDLNDEELDRYVHDPDEVLAKTALWTEINKEYLEAQAEKDREEAAALAAGRPIPKKKKRRREKKDVVALEPGAAAASAAEAAAEGVRKRTNAQVNPQAFQQLFSYPPVPRKPTQKAVAEVAVVSAPMASEMDDIEGSAAAQEPYSDMYYDNDGAEYAPYWDDG